MLKEVKLKLMASNQEMISAWMPFQDLRFALCTRKDENTVVQQTDITICREILVHSAKTAFIDSASGPYVRTGTDLSKSDKTIMMWFSKRNIRAPKDMIKDKGLLERMFRNSLKILNFFESIANFEKTVLYNAKSDLSDDHLFYVFEGDRQWMNVPYLLSLYGLLIRLGRFQELKDFKTHEEFLINCKRLTEEFVDLRLAHNSSSEAGIRYREKFHSYPDGIIEDLLHVHEVGDKIKMLLENREKLFGDVKRKDLYRVTDEADGITRFCKGYINSDPLLSKLTKRFTELCKENNLKFDKKSPITL